MCSLFASCLFLAITSSHFSFALAEILIHSLFRACGMVKLAAIRSHTSRGARTARARNVSAPEISNTMAKPVPKDKFKPVLCKQGYMVQGGLKNRSALSSLTGRTARSSRSTREIIGFASLQLESRAVGIRSSGLQSLRFFSVALIPW